MLWKSIRSTCPQVPKPWVMIGLIPATGRLRFIRVMQIGHMLVNILHRSRPIFESVPQDEHITCTPLYGLGREPSLFQYRLPQKYYPLFCIHVYSFVNNGNTNDIIRTCHKNKSLTACNEGIIFTPLVYLWVNWSQQLDRLSIMQTDHCSQYCCIFFFCYQLPWLWRSLHEGDELFVEHGDMRAQFLWQILHTFNNVLMNKNGMALLFALCSSGRGGEVQERQGGDQERPLLHAHQETAVLVMGSQNKWCAVMPKWEKIESDIDGGIK